MSVSESYSNNLPVDLYKLLLPDIKEEDQKTGTMAYLDFWDTPEAEITEWDQEVPFVAVWDRIGLKPVLQRLFWCLETQEGRMLEELRAMEDLIDPDTCPARFLPYMAASLGFDLPDSMSEAERRVTIKGLVAAYKQRGTPISWKVFFRMVGYRVMFYPLWKKAYAEDQDRYSQERYAATTPFGPLVITAFTPSLPQAPLKPTSILITDGTETFRDDGKGGLVGGLGGTGTVNYLTGAINVNFYPPGPVGPISLTAETVDDEYPYHAARVDLDFFLVPLSGAPPPDVDDEFVKNVLRHLDEVRPIHVILRTFNLVMPIEELLEDFASDGGCCGPSLGVDHWTSKEMFYVGDVGPVGKDGGMLIERDDGSKQQCMEDVTPFVNPLSGDPLVITSSPPQPSDGSY